MDELEKGAQTRSPPPRSTGKEGGDSRPEQIKRSQGMSLWIWLVGPERWDRLESRNRLQKGLEKFLHDRSMTGGLLRGVRDVWGTSLTCQEDIREGGQPLGSDAQSWPRKWGVQRRRAMGREVMWMGLGSLQASSKPYDGGE